MACGRPGNRKRAQSGAGASSSSKRVEIPSTKPAVPRFVAFYSESHNDFINSQTFTSSKSRFYFIRLRPRPGLEKVTEYGKNFYSLVANSTIYLLMSSLVPGKASTRMHRKWRLSALGAWHSGIALGWQSLTDLIPSLVRLS
jgi:hypothetical protein